MPQKLTIEEFIENSKKIHKDKYDYSKVFYTNSYTRVIIICPNHGEFEQAPDKHINRQQGCPKCGKIKSSLNKSKPPKNKSLKDISPEVSSEWSLNNEFGAEHYRNVSGFKAKWICKICSKEFVARIADRTLLKSKCPYCFGNWVVSDRNRLSTTKPKIASSWDYEKNYPLTPNDICYGSRIKYYWKCDNCSDSYYMSCVNRNNGQNCPKCKWKFSKGERLTESILIENKILYQKQYMFEDCKDKRKLRFDFAIWINNKLGLIEYNGPQHYIKDYDFINSDYVQKHDKIKEKYCKDNNIPLLSIPYTRINFIEQEILDWLNVYYTFAL